jgi:hypothetical protein
LEVSRATIASIAGRDLEIAEELTLGRGPEQVKRLEALVSDHPAEGRGRERRGAGAAVNRNSWPPGRKSAGSRVWVPT